MEEIKWGIIGCGDVAERKSGPAFQQLPNSRLIAVMRRDACKAADFAARHQVSAWYSDARDLINDPAVNAVYVATPPQSHEAYATAALAAGKHVYLEKPMALNSAAALRIQAKVTVSRGRLVIAHYRRALPAFIKVKELLADGRIGRPLFAKIHIWQPPQSGLVAISETNWRIDPALSGGGLFHDLAPHQLDLMIHYFGAVEEACGFSANHLHTSAADDFVSGLIKFKSGVNFCGLWCFSAAESVATDSCEIIGTEGKISFSFFGEEVELRKNHHQQTFRFKNPGYIQQPMIEKVIAHFLGHADNPCAANEGLEVMRLMDAFTGSNAKIQEINQKTKSP